MCSAAESWVAQFVEVESWGAASSEVASWEAVSLGAASSVAGSWADEWPEDACSTMCVQPAQRQMVKWSKDAFFADILPDAQNRKLTEDMFSEPFDHFLVGHRGMAYFTGLSTENT